MAKEVTYLTGTVLDEDLEYGLLDICRLCNITAEAVCDMIDEGLIDPRGREPMQWRFTAVQIRRIQVTIRLQRDLRINLPGCALVLDLLEELDKLQRRSP
jgi:chaperone modulatory protein CbpM